MTGQNKQKAVETYWLDKLSGTLPKISLPRYHREESGTPGKKRLRFEIEKPVFAALQEMGDNSHFEVFILLLSGLNIALYKYTGIEDILVGTIWPQKEGVENNLIFCRTRVDRGLTLKETIKRIKKDVQQDLNYIDYSFADLYQKLAAKGDIDSIEIFNTALIYGKFQEENKLLDQYDLLFTFTTAGEQPVLQVDYKSNLYTGETAAGFCRNLIFFFANLPANLERNIADIEITRPEEKELLLKFNDTETPFYLDKTIPQMFEDQVDRSPGRTAVVCGSWRLTYGALNKRANQLAWILADKGVKKGAIVGLMLERSLEAVTAMLAIMKAGGAYLPMDPQMPRNRILTMLRDSSAQLLLTSSGIMQKHSFTSLQGLDDKNIKPFYTSSRKQPSTRDFPAKGKAADTLKVLFLDLFRSFNSPGIHSDVVAPRIGGRYAKTYLEEQLGDKVDTKILQSCFDFNNYNELKKMLVEFDPQVIGVRTVTFNRDFFHSTIQAVRQWGIEAHIIACGPYASSNYDSILQDRNIDLLVKDEDEAAFCGIIEKVLENNGKLPGDEVLHKISGIGFVPGEEKEGKGFAREIILLDELTDALSWEGTADLEPVSGAGDPAYVIFTPGSTGKPKGVLVEHRNVINNLHWFAHRYGIKEEVRVAQLTHYTFDPGVEQIFVALLNGATLCIPGDGRGATDREESRAFIEQNKVNVVKSSPAVLKELLGSGEKLSSVRTVISGAEKLDRAVKERLIERGYELYNHYGCTETAVEALTDSCSAGNVALGKPIANTSVFILTKDLNLAPIGVTGELYIAGAGVSRGYLNRPEPTAEKFENRSYRCNRSYKSYRTYKTGDLARWLPEGKVEFLGRIDQQVKIRGFRIELGEIESRLLEYRGIKEAVVTDRQDKKGDKYLCAYYTWVPPGADADSGPGSNDLRRFLSGSLPNYMVPSQFVQLDKMPLNPGGKVDYRKLPMPSFESFSEYAAPTGEVEETLTGIWSRVLGIGREDIGIDSNFFDIGGDSIKVVQVSAKLHRYGMTMESIDMFANPTIRQLAAHVKPLQRKIDQGAVTGEIPLTPMQRWFFRQGMEDKRHYNQGVMLYSKEGFAEEAVREVFTKLQEHHDALRITFREEKGGVIQENNDLDYPLALYIEDFRGKSGKNEALEALQAKVKEIRSGINLEEGPLMKLGLFHMDDGDRLLIVIHRLIIDTVSWRILFEDMDTLYRQYINGKPFVLPLKTDSFQYWAGKLLQYTDSKTFLAGVITNLGRIEAGFAGSHSGWDHFPVFLEDCSRERFLKDIDVTRTVGWFSSLYPEVADTAAKAGETQKRD